MKNFIVMHKVSVLILFTAVVILFFSVHDHFKYKVKLTMCDISYSNCNVYAKFKSMDSCEFYKEYSSLLCSTNVDGNKECKTNNNPSIVSYCTP